MPVEECSSFVRGRSLLPYSKRPSTSAGEWESIRRAESTSLCTSPYISICADSWTKAGCHVTAITAGSPGQAIYMNSYENLGSDTDDVSAKAIHEGIIVSLGLKPDTTSNDQSFPVEKLAVMTSDTTAVMPATAKRLGEMDPC
jgi:hypothetical protein